MAETADHYRVLGLSPDATTEQIKLAYHRAAKRAHPDAGGNASLMEQVNEAYRILSDPDLREEYDARRRAPEPHRAAAEPADATQGQATSSAPPSEAEIAHHHHRRRMAAARASGWQILKANATMALLLGIIAVFFSSQTPELLPRIGLALISSAPIYGALLGIIFFIEPQLRLNLYDLVSDLLHRRDPRQYLSRSELNVLIGLALLFLPIALIWTITLLVFIKPL